MTVAQNLCVKKSYILDTSNIECVWHALCVTYCCHEDAPGLFVVTIVIFITVNTVWKGVLLTRAAAVTLTFNKQGCT